METTGQRIKLLRKRLSLTQEKFAALIGVTRGAVGNWERGLGITSENITLIAHRTGAPVEWVMTGRGEAPSTLRANGSGVLRGEEKAMLSEDEAIDALTWALAALRVASEPEARVLARAVIRAFREPAPTEAARRAGVGRAVRLFRP